MCFSWQLSAMDLQTGRVLTYRTIYLMKPQWQRPDQYPSRPTRYLETRRCHRTALSRTQQDAVITKTTAFALYPKTSLRFFDQTPRETWRLDRCSVRVVLLTEREDFCLCLRMLGWIATGGLGLVLFSGPKRCTVSLCTQVSHMGPQSIRHSFAHHAQDCAACS